jgi:hypothetical protein
MQNVRISSRVPKLNIELEYPAAQKLWSTKRLQIMNSDIQAHATNYEYT